MKSFTKFLFSAVILLHATVLFAMDPVVPSVIEKEAQALGEELGVFGKKTAPAQIAIATTAVESSSVGSSSSNAANAMISNQRVAEATGEENTTNQFLEDEICNNIYQSCLAKVVLMSLDKEKAAEATRKFLEARSNVLATIGDMANSWHGVANSLEKTSEYWTKATEVQEAGKTTLAAAYREAAATSQRAADQWELSAQTKAAGKQSEGWSWEWGGSSLQSEADYVVKAAEAQEAGKTTLAAAYHEAAVTSQVAADQYKQSAQARAAENLSEGACLFNKAEATQAKANAIASKVEN